MKYLIKITFIIFLSINLQGQDLIIDSKIDSLSKISKVLESEIKPLQTKLDLVNDEIKILKLQKETQNQKNIESNGILTTTTGGETELYQNHDYQSKNLITIPDNSEIKVFEKHDYFLKVEYNGILGWVNEGWVSNNEEIKSLKDKKPSYTNSNSTNSTKTSGPKSNNLDLRSYATVHKQPSEESLELKSFDKNNVTLIGYSNGMFKIKSQSGKIGYTPYGDIGYDEASYFKPILEEEHAQKAKSQGKAIYIKGAGVTEINSASGVDFSIDWGYFNSQKDIKYVEFTVEPYNKVGDIQRCSISGHSTFTGKVTGPISSSDKFDRSVWGTAWYNNTISCIRITKVVVKYLDGSNYTYINELPKIMDEEYKNSCAY